jgi:hypothetical protein
MDKESAKSLRQALDHLKSGDVKSARKLLVDILKTNPGNEQAWYMMSFAVPDKEKQIYSLNQVLRINPSHEKAQNRLIKIQDDSIEVPEDDKVPFLDEKVIQSERAEPQGDLLAQRLFDTVDIPDKEQKDVAEKIHEPRKTEPLPGEIVKEPDTTPLILRDEIKVKQVSSPISKGLFSRIPRRTLLLITLCVVVIGASILVLGDGLNFGGFIPSIQSPSGSVSVPISTSTIQPTPTEIGGALPPTWTPVPLEEDDIPSIDEDSILSLNSLTPPSSEVLAHINNIQNQLVTSRFDRVVDVESFMLSKGEFEHLLSDFSLIQGYQEHIENRELVYRALGLINPWDDLSNFTPNLWADPNGGLYLPDEKSILLESKDFNIVESYLYARGYAQALIDDQFSLEGFGIYPICVHQLQQCEVLYAMIKGDATLLANEWLDEYGPADQIWMIDTLEADYFGLPMQSPPIFIERELEFSHTSGSVFVEALFDHGGGSYINSVYENPPSTTEQILHPEKFIDGEQGIEVEPIPLNTGLDDVWMEIINESLGEWLTYQILSSGVNENAIIPPEISQVATEGWGGDLTQIYYNNLADQFVVSAHWKWDTQIDADEFYSALVEYVTLRFSGAEEIEKQGAECWHSLFESTCIIKESNDIFWLVAPDITVVDLILSLYTIGS